MKSLARAAVATSLIAISASIAAAPAQAQNPLELRADLFRFQTADGNSLIQLAFPGALAMAPSGASNRSAMEATISGGAWWAMAAAQMASAEPVALK